MPHANAKGQEVRRRLRFQTIADVYSELDRIAAADRNGALKAVGRWSPGQILGHVASWIEYGYEGYPLGPPPWFIRLILKWKLKKYLRDGMPAGVRIPGTKEGTFGIDALEFAEGNRRLRAALGRIDRGERPQFDNPGFGPMSMADWLQLNLRHAELHLGFLRYS